MNLPGVRNKGQNQDPFFETESRSMRLSSEILTLKTEQVVSEENAFD